MKKNLKHFYNNKQLLPQSATDKFLRQPADQDDNNLNVRSSKYGGKSGKFAANEIL